MREPPRLTESTIQATLAAYYDLPAVMITFLPLGNDSASFVYRVEAIDGGSYLLKGRAGSGFSAPSLLIPRFLHEQGLPHVVTPLPTTTGAVWIDLHDFALSLYPFIEAQTADEAGLSRRHWQALGATLRQIHMTHLPNDLYHLMPRETFIPSRRELIPELEALLASPALTDPVQRELAAFWQAQRERIRMVVQRADELGDQLRQTSLPLVLCHADLHTWNVLLDAEGQLWIVDWDETILAPKERDLMFVIGGIGHDLVRADETASFLQGYGAAAIDQTALTYYRYAWAVQDLAAYAEQVCFALDLSESTRRDELRGLIELFAPGNIVAIACESEYGML